MNKKKYKKMRYYFYGILGMLFLMCVLVYQVVVQSLELRNMSKEDVANTEVDVTYEFANNVLETVQYYLEQDEAIQQQIDETENKYTELEIAYNKKMYLDSIVAEMDKTNGSTAYLDRYFRIEKDKLQEIVYKSDVSGELAAEFSGAQTRSDFLPVGEKIWLRYDGDNIFPEGIMIQNPLINVGYKDAKIGMTLSGIQELIPNSEIKIVNDVYYYGYVRFEDENYFYYYIKIFEYRNSTILYVQPKTRIYCASEKQVVFFDELENYMEQDSAQNATIFTFGNNMELAAKVEKKKNELSELQHKLQFLQLKYDLAILLEEKSNEEEDSFLIYEKYFRLKQGELARIEGMEKLGDTCDLNVYLYGTTFQVGNDILVKYPNYTYIEEYLLPVTIIVTESSANLGYMDARAGMNFEEIQENAYTKNIQEGFMYEDESTGYYIEYEDAYYKYIFLSKYADGRDSWLLVSKKSETVAIGELYYYEGTDCEEETEDNCKALNLYGDILEECEWVWENPDAYIAKRNLDLIDDKYDGIYGCATRAEKYGYTLLYCIKDLNNDEIPELVIGVKDLDDNTTSIKMVFFYTEGKLNSFYVDRYIMNIFKGGIIEWWGGVCQHDEYSYYRIVNNSGQLEHLEDFEIIDGTRFYQTINEKQVELTEEEFYNRINVFKEMGEESFEWREIEGFAE